jgi:anti-anti-sigma factor
MDDADPDVTLRHSVATGEDGNVTVALEGELDLATSETLGAALEDTIASVTGTLIVDTTELRFADSSAIALWVRWATAVEDLELRDPSPLLRTVITSMGLGGRLKLVP